MSAATRPVEAAAPKNEWLCMWEVLVALILPPLLGATAAGLTTAILWGLLQPHSVMGLDLMENPPFLTWLPCYGKYTAITWEYRLTQFNWWDPIRNALFIASATGLAIFFSLNHPPKGIQQLSQARDPHRLQRNLKLWVPVLGCCVGVLLSAIWLSAQPRATSSVAYTGETSLPYSKALLSNANAQRQSVQYEHRFLDLTGDQRFIEEGKRAHRAYSLLIIIGGFLLTWYGWRVCLWHAILLHHPELAEKSTPVAAPTVA